MQQYTKSQNLALLFIRLVVAAVFLVAAYYKLPLWSGVPEGMSPFMLGLMKILTVIEPLSALALIIGFLTRYVAGGLSIIMVGAIFVTKFMIGIGFVTPTGAGWNFPLVVLASCVALMV